MPSPIAPSSSVELQGDDLVLKSFVNGFEFREFEEDEVGILRFVLWERYRMGSPDDVGWRRGRCKFSAIAPKWGEFYGVEGDASLLESPADWKLVRPSHGRDGASCFTSAITLLNA